MDVLIISNELPPTTKANSTIAYNLAVSLFDDTRITSVDFISTTAKKNLKGNIKGINFINIKASIIDKLYIKKIRKISVDSRTKKVLLCLTDFELTTYYVLSKVLRIRQRLFVKELNNLNKKNSYQLVLAITNPIEIIKYLYNSKIKSKIVWYQLDPYSIHELRKPSQYNKRIITEIKYIEFVDKVLVPEWFYDCLLDVIPHNLSYKIIKTGIPIVDKKDLKKTSDIVFKKVDKIFFYAGSFYNYIREPNVLLDFLELLFLNQNYIFYYAGPHFKYIQKYIHIHELRNLNDKVINLGILSSEDIHHLISKADILVNIDNKLKYQVPSKLFDYTSRGKIILNFTNNYSDFSLNLLKLYGKAYNVYEEENINLSVKTFKTFISSKNALQRNNLNFKKRLKIYEISNIVDSIIN